MKTFTLLVCTLLFLTGCEQGELLPGFLQFNKTTIAEKTDRGTVTGYKDYRDLNYGDDPRFHKFDVFRPVFQEKEEPSVAFIMIHGGSWYFLDKGANESSIQQLKARKKNVTIFNINHRLTQVKGITYQNQLEDIDRFIRYLDDNKARFNLTGDYVLWGYSSGGHLALTYCYTRSKNKQLRAVASVAGPTDLTDEFLRNRLWMDNQNLTELAVGCKYNEKPTSFKEASPYYCIGKDETPTILFYAGKDDVVPRVHGQLLANELNRKNNKVAFHEFENNSHNMESMSESFDLLFEFLKGVKD